MSLFTCLFGMYTNEETRRKQGLLVNTMENNISLFLNTENCNNSHFDPLINYPSYLNKQLLNNALSLEWLLSAK